MTTIVNSTQVVAERLRTAQYGVGLSACGFRFWVDEALGEVVEVVLILDHDTWDEAAIESCERARRVTDEALWDLPYFASPVCRTRTEHASFSGRERGLWVPVELNGDC